MHLLPGGQDVRTAWRAGSSRAVVMCRRPGGRACRLVHWLGPGAHKAVAAGTALTAAAALIVAAGVVMSSLWVPIMLP